MPCGSGSPSHHLLHPCSIRPPPVTKFGFCQWLDVNFSLTLQVLAQIGVLSSCVLSTLARIKDPPLRHFWRPPQPINWSGGHTARGATAFVNSEIAIKPRNEQLLEIIADSPRRIKIQVRVSRDLHSHSVIYKFKQEKKMAELRTTEGKKLLSTSH